MAAHWVMPLKGRDCPWHCPRCGKVETYGSRRSLWSLIPGICIHRVVRWDERVELHPFLTDDLAYVDVGKTVPVVERNPIVRFLRGRLTDEIRGHRKFWWAPYTRAYKQERDRVRLGGFSI